MKRKTTHWLLLILILLSFGRGVWALGDKSLWWDESLSVHRATGTLSSVLSNRIVLTDNLTTVNTIDNHPPFYFLLLWVAVRLLGQTEFSLRILSLLSVVLIVPLLFATGKRLVDDWAGLAAAALGALSPMYLWYGQEARMYSLLALLSLLAFYCFVRAFYQPAGRLDIRRHWPWIAAWMAASLLAVLTHYLSALLIGFQLAALIVISVRQAENRRAILLTILAIVLITLPLLVYALLTLPIAGNQPGFYFVPLGDLLRDLLNSFSLGLSVNIDHWPILAIDLVFALFLVTGLVFLVRPGAPTRWRGAGWLLAGYLVLPIVAIFLLSYIQPTYMNSRHLIMITPPFYLLVGVGLTRWKGRARLIAIIGGLVLFVGMGYSTWNYFTESEYNKDNHQEWGTYLREHSRPGDVVVVNPAHIAELYEYYADSGLPWIGLPLLEKSEEDSFAILEDLLRRYDRVWLAQSRTPPWGDKGRRILKWLDNNAFRADYKPVHSYASSVFAAAYLKDWPSVPSLPGNAQPLEVRYSPALQLMGYRLVSPAQPGKNLHVQLFWQVDEPIPEEASVALRLVDEMGHVWGQGEQCPYNGLYPMWQWQPGLRLPTEHEVAIEPGTPPGTYQLELVLVSRPTEDGCLGPPGEQILPALAPARANRGDRIILGSLQVERPEEPVPFDGLDSTRQHGVRFGELELLSSDVKPTEVEAGGRLAVALYWQGHVAPLPDTLFRLRLISDSGETLVEKTIRPARYVYPTDRWQAGDYFKGQFWLQLPESLPGGQHRLELVAEPPVQRSGPWAALLRTFGGQEPGVELGSIQVEAREADPSVPATPVPPPAESPASVALMATMGDKVRFLGYDPSPGPVLAGEELSFTLYWQALRPMEASYTVFTHLLGPDDQVLGQMDSVPQYGGYPTTLWQPGEIIADSYSFTVEPGAPPGAYPMEIGMYRLDTATRLPVVDADGQPLPDGRILLPETIILPAPTPVPIDKSSWQWIYLPMIEGGYEGLAPGP